MKNSFIIMAFLLPCFFISCRNVEKTTDNINIADSTIKSEQNKKYMARPPILIYKTKGDYFNKVPVNLTVDRENISSYPDIIDVYYQGELAYPTRLANGYLLDNRGIGPDVAFLDITYDQYCKLEQTPSPEELLKHILDSDPLLELHSCTCERDTAVLNEMIRKNSFPDCKKLK